MPVHLAAMQCWSIEAPSQRRPSGSFPNHRRSHERLVCISSGFVTKFRFRTQFRVSSFSHQNEREQPPSDCKFVVELDARVQATTR